jgi:pimeloyl-ACP methyl ester carboxylesterase
MDEVILNHQVAGDGPALLLVHGFGISLNIWKNLIPFLGSNFTLVMMELPGIGKSPMPARDRDYLGSCVDSLEALRLALGFKAWDVLGYSTGSRVAEAYVQAHARSVGRAIFLCPVALDLLKAAGLHFGFWLDGFTPAAGDWLLRGRSLRFFVSWLGFNLLPDPHAEEWTAEIGGRPLPVLKETLRVIDRLGRRPFSVPVPFDMIWGDMDVVPATPPRGGGRDHFVHANHAAPVLAAEEVAATIKAVLKK